MASPLWFKFRIWCGLVPYYQLVHYVEQPRPYQPYNHRSKGHALHLAGVQPPATCLAHGEEDCQHLSAASGLPQVP